MCSTSCYQPDHNRTSHGVGLPVLACLEARTLQGENDDYSHTYSHAFPAQEKWDAGRLQPAFFTALISFFSGAFLQRPFCGFLSYDLFLVVWLHLCTQGWRVCVQQAKSCYSWHVLYTVRKKVLSRLINPLPKYKQCKYTLKRPDMVLKLCNLNEF